MELSSARLMAMVRQLRKMPKPDLDLIKRLEAKAKEQREAAITAQAVKDLEAYLKSK